MFLTKHPFLGGKPCFAIGWGANNVTIKQVNG